MTPPSAKTVYGEVIKNPRYLKNIEHGKPRRGHAEGTVKAHIEELEKNLQTIRLQSKMDFETYWKLKVLIHVHDSFKAEAVPDSPIMDPKSHASIARDFLSGYTSDPDLLNITQYHDIGYVVFRKWKQTGRMNEARVDEALAKINDLDLFLLFAIIDACTESKGREAINWLVSYVNSKHQVNIGPSWILPGKAVTENGEW